MIEPEPSDAPGDRCRALAARDGIAVLHFHVRGTFTALEWSIGCDVATDTEDTLRAHLARWRPDCELDSVEIRPVRANEP